MTATPALDTLRRDLRDGVRALTGRPGFTAVAVLSLALGIGANTAAFSFVNAVALRDTGIDRPEEIVNFYTHYVAFAFASVSYPNYEDLRDGTTEVFSAMGASQGLPVSMDEDGRVTVVRAEAVTGSYLPMLGIDAVLGRTLLPSDDVHRGGHPVVMLDHRYWQSAFGGDEDIVGKELRLAGRSYTVIGVGPPDFEGRRFSPPAFYAPYTMVEELLGSRMFDCRGCAYSLPRARLRPGITLAQAEAAVSAVGTRLTEDRIAGWAPDAQLVLLPLTDVLIHPNDDKGLRQGIWLFMVVVGLVLFLACTNLASFLLARALDRRKDIAVRLAFGASPVSVVRRLLTETTLLSLIAGAVSVVSAHWFLTLLENAQAGAEALPSSMGYSPPATFDLSLDWNVLAFTLGISLLAGVLVGLVPALQSTRTDMATTLKGESAGGGQRGQLRWRNALVITQVAVSLVLLVNAGLFLRSSRQMQSVDPGFGQEPTALMTFKVPSARFTVEEGRVYARLMLDRFRQLPGFEAVGFIDYLPLSGNVYPTDFNVDGHEPPTDHGAFLAEQAEVDAGFFDAAGIRIVRGRNFTDADRSDSEPVVIISEVMAQRFWQDGDAVGREFRLFGRGLRVTVVGVASDTKVRALDEAPRNMIYRPYSQQWSSEMTVVARTSADPDQTVRALISAGREVDPDLWVSGATTMTRHLSRRLEGMRGPAFSLLLFAVLAMALAAIGLYGVVSYSVAGRTREIGILMALGADGPRVVRLLAFSSGLKLVIIGVAIGLAIALVTTWLLSGLLLEVHPLDPMTFILVPLVLGATGLLAAFVPALRASRIDPVEALRNE
jgi:putative ABC transport system permease protein